MYIDAMIKNFSSVVAENASVATPMLENLKLLPTEEETLTEEQSQFVTNFPYRQLIIANLYVNVCTRPAISQAILVLAQFNNSPTLQACLAVVRLTQFVYNTRKDRLAIFGGAEKPIITTFCDSDWAGCVETRISRSGHIIFMGNGPVIWYSKKQTSTSLSSCEAEYMAMTPCIQNVNYVKRIVTCAGIPNVMYRLSFGLWTDNI